MHPPITSFHMCLLHTPSSWCAWLSSPAPPAAAVPALRASRTPAPSCGCGWAPPGAAGAPGPSDSPAGSGSAGAPAGGAPWSRNTVPASEKPAQRGAECVYLFTVRLTVCHRSLTKRKPRPRSGSQAGNLETRSATSYLLTSCGAVRNSRRVSICHWG